MILRRDQWEHILNKIDMSYVWKHEVKYLRETLTFLEDERIKRGPICLVCGAAEPCSLQDDLFSPCTFDPTSRALWDENKRLREEIGRYKNFKPTDLMKGERDDQDKAGLL